MATSDLVDTAAAAASISGLDTQLDEGPKGGDTVCGPGVDNANETG